MDYWTLGAVVSVGVISIVGFFITKSKGYGRYTTSIFLILVALIFSSILFVVGGFDSDVMGNIVFAVVGFAGGLFANKTDE